MSEIQLVQYRIKWQDTAVTAIKVIRVPYKTLYLVTILSTIDFANNRLLYNTKYVIQT
jgi:hypothetical protein